MCAVIVKLKGKDHIVRAKKKKEKDRFHGLVLQKKNNGRAILTYYL